MPTLFFRDTQTEPGTGSVDGMEVFDLSETQGSPTATVSNNVNSGTFTPVVAFTAVPANPISDDQFPVSVNIPAFSGSPEVRFRVERVDSGGTVQAFSDWSATISSTGVHTETLTLATTWAASDRVRVVFEIRRASGHGQVDANISVQDADSFVDVTQQAPITGSATDSNPSQSDSGTGSFEEPVRADVTDANPSQSDSGTGSWVEPPNEPVYEESVTGGAGDSSEVDSVASDTQIGGGTDQLYIVTVAVQPTSGGSGNVTGITGGGLTWELVGSIESARGATYIEMWKAFGSPGSAFTVTANYSKLVNALSLIASRYSGASDVTGFESATTDGTDNNSLAVSATSTVDGSAHYTSVNLRNGAIDTHDPDYDLRASQLAGSGGAEANAHSFDRIMETAGSDEFTATLAGNEDWTAVAAVIEPAAEEDDHAASATDANPSQSDAGTGTHFGADVKAFDSFSRVEAGQWGTAEVGGNWDVDGAPTWSVNEHGIASFAGTGNGNATLQSLDAYVLNSRSRARVRISEGAPDTGFHTVQVYARRDDQVTDGDNYYRFRARFPASGNIDVRLEKEVDGVSSFVTSNIDVGLTFSVGQWYELEWECIGEDPTTLRFRVWEEGQSVPDWQIDESHSEPALDGIGTTGFRFEPSSTNTTFPVVFQADDLEALEVDEEAAPAASVTDANPSQSDAADASHVAPVSADASDSNPAQSDAATATHETPEFTGSASDQNPSQGDAADASHAAPEFTGSASDANPSQSDSSTGAHETPGFSASTSDTNPGQSDDAAGTHAAPEFSGSASDQNPGQSDAAAGSFEETPVSASVTDANPSQADSATGEVDPPPVSGSATDQNPGQADAVEGSVTAPEFTADASDQTPAQSDSGGATHAAPVHSVEVTDQNPEQSDAGTGSFEETPVSASVSDQNPGQSDAVDGSVLPPEVSADASDQNPSQSDSGDGSHAVPAVSASVGDQNPTQSDSAASSHETPEFTGQVSDQNPGQSDAADARFEEAADVTASVSDANPGQSDAAAGSHDEPITGQVSDQNPAQSDAAAASFEETPVSGSVSDQNPGQSDDAAGAHDTPEFTATGSDANPSQSDDADGDHDAPTFEATVFDPNTLQDDAATGGFEPPVFPGSVSDQNPGQSDTGAGVLVVSSPVGSATDANPAQSDAASGTWNETPPIEGPVEGAVAIEPGVQGSGTVQGLPGTVTVSHVVGEVEILPEG